MALFKKTEKKAEKSAEEPKAVTTVAAKDSAKETAQTPPPASVRVLLSARITEKATDLAMQNVYSFNVALGATKRQIMEAVKVLYKVTPVKVRTISIPRKVVSHPRLRKEGFSNLGKKAYVTLKKGDTISLK